MKKKSYKITFGLQEGYAKSGRLHTLKFAGQVLKKWMAARLAAKSPVVTGLLQDGILFFPAVNSEEQVTVSPSAIFTGELSTPEDLKRKNKEVIQTEGLANISRKAPTAIGLYHLPRPVLVRLVSG